MGTDIHAMGERRSFANGSARWVCAGELRLGRSYKLFELLGGRGEPPFLSEPGIPGVRDWDGSFECGLANGRVDFRELASEPFQAWAASYAPHGHSHGWIPLGDLTDYPVTAGLLVEQAEWMGASRVCFFFDS